MRARRGSFGKSFTSTHQRRPVEPSGVQWQESEWSSRLRRQLTDARSAITVVDPLNLDGAAIQWLPVVQPHHRGTAVVSLISSKSVSILRPTTNTEQISIHKCQMKYLFGHCATQVTFFNVGKKMLSGKFALTLFLSALSCMSFAEPGDECEKKSDCDQGERCRNNICVRSQPVVPNGGSGDDRRQSGSICCDQFGSGRCMIGNGPQPLGSGCFCNGQGYGYICR